MKEQRKVVSFVLGAGFSHSLAGQKLAGQFSEDLKIKFENFRVRQLEEGSSQYFLDWISGFEHDGFWDFELIADAIRHVGNLLDYGYLQEPSKDLIEDFFNFLNTSLCKEYLTFEVKKEYEKKFVELITYLLEQGYEINFFDINFDLVLEAILKNNNLPCNDFFQNTIGLPTNDFDIVGFSDVFNSEILGDINIYKLHGAFNILCSGDKLHHSHTGISVQLSETDKRCIHNLRYGFRKVKNLLEDKEVVEAMKDDFSQAVQGLTHMMGFNAQNILWTGNSFKLAMIGLAQSYSNFCYRNFEDKLKQSETIFVVGYGARDPNVNRVLELNLPFECFMERSSINTIVHSKNTDINSKLGSNLKSNLYFEKYLSNLNI